MTKIERMAREYKENKALIEELTALNDTLKAEIVALMGENETVQKNDITITNKTVESSRLDGTALKAAEPETYNRYLKKTTYKRFSVK